MDTISAIDQFEQLLDPDPEFRASRTISWARSWSGEQRFPEAVVALEQALIFGGESPEAVAYAGVHPRARG